MNGYFAAAFLLLSVGALMCMYRIGRGPTAPDRAVAIDILGTLVVGFSCLYALLTGHDFYINIAIAWAMISFVGTIALAKYLEGRPFDE